MYNSEQYIGECLESILAQTFDDYEVIVVDDCSKDNSCKIVELYIPKFGNRLRLIRSEKKFRWRRNSPQYRYKDSYRRLFFLYGQRRCYSS